ncbi:tyrosine-type recombinase/integrase [Aneurinibacillus tyrosinisolvens]|uniref:tyrosine-type recombinase/integrase n=1 Tax=Aneurinibacillus tyrosinisolvens TaxID=1443435 RepID=UPI0009E44CD4|nr:tyrosine-type recombinase/integrase [Aneurinibacillus tyrosinisolvens]
MKFTQAADDYLMSLEVEKNYSKNTLRGYAFNLKNYEDFLRHQNRSLELDDLTPSTSRRFIQDQVMNHGAKPKTMQRRISCLKSFNQFCLKENYIKTDFMAGIQAPKTEKKLPVYMTLQELQKLFIFLENNDSRLSARNHLLFKLLATTGMRRQELVDLNWEQVDLSNNTIRIYGKGKKERLLPLHPMVIPLFCRYREQLLEYQVHSSITCKVKSEGEPLSAVCIEPSNGFKKSQYGLSVRNVPSSLRAK